MSDDEKPELHKSTKAVLKKQLGGALEKPQVQTYVPKTYIDDDDYDGETYTHLYQTLYGGNATDRAIEFKAERTIEEMEMDPSYIQTVATYETVEVMAEILRQLLLR
jgi:hypothetical protein